MRIWRLTRRAFQEMDGEGARKAGGRWNSEGIPVVYTSSTLALAGLEYLLHVEADDVPDDLIAMQIEVPDEAPLQENPAADLPRGWNRKPQHPACVEVGDRWIADGRALAPRPLSDRSRGTQLPAQPGPPGCGARPGDSSARIRLRSMAALNGSGPARPQLGQRDGRDLPLGFRAVQR